MERVFFSMAYGDRTKGEVKDSRCCKEILHCEGAEPLAQGVQRAVVPWKCPRAVWLGLGAP